VDEPDATNKLSRGAAGMRTAAELELGGRMARVAIVSFRVLWRRERSVPRAEDEDDDECDDETEGDEDGEEDASGDATNLDDEEEESETDDRRDDDDG
jgi:hypothetical protein